MKPLKAMFSLVAVISLFVGAIWQGSAAAATNPVVAPLGRVIGFSLVEAPTALDVDASGNLYVADVIKGQVTKFDKYMKVVRVYDGMGVAGTSLAVTSDGSKLYVGAGKKVNILSGDSGLVIGHLGSGAGEFKFAGEIDIDPVSERVYVAEPGTFGVKVYDLNTGKYLFRFGSRGRAYGQFRNLWSLSFNEHRGEVYVSDAYSYSRYRPNVQVFNRDGKFLRALTGYSSFGSPGIPFFTGMAFDPQGRGYFLDTIHGSIRFLGLPTAKLGQYAKAGYREGQLAMPRDIAYDAATGRLFVTCDGSRIEIFGVDGAQNPENANVAPGQPTPVSPLGDIEVATATPRLTYGNAEDADGDDLVYDVKVFSGEAVVADYVGLPSSEVESYANVDSALAENGRFGWSVRAFDGEAASDWTAQQYFYVNAVEEAPTAPAALIPETGSVADGATVLGWDVATDPDPFDSVSYKIEISVDAEFTQIVAGADFVGNEAVLGEFADYLALEDGETYFWRAMAIDNHGLVSAPGAASSFVYDTTILTFSANMPDASVYLGGNYAYSGRYIGTTPVELRDVPAGVETVVVKRAGFEPFVGQVVIGERENIDYFAELIPAIMPEDVKAQPLSADGEKIVMNDAVAPFVIDLDGDGIVDLVAATASGAIERFNGSLVDGTLQFTSVGPFAPELPLVSGARPVLVDWNNDRTLDLLIGGTDGSVSLFVGSAGGFVQTALNVAGGLPVTVSGDAAPVVYDVDNDGDKDLLVGSSEGTIVQFLNVGSDSEPLLTVSDPLLLNPAPADGSVAPFIVDWDADGSDDLLVVYNDRINLYSPGETGYDRDRILAVGQGGRRNLGYRSAGSSSVGTRLTLFALDLNGTKGKDLLVGNAAGEIRFVRSFGKEKVAAFYIALLDKVAQISAFDDSIDTADIVAAINANDDQAITKAARNMLKKAGPDVQAGVNQIIDFLK